MVTGCGLGGEEAAQLGASQTDLAFLNDGILHQPRSTVVWRDLERRHPPSINSFELGDPLKSDPITLRLLDAVLSHRAMSLRPRPGVPSMLGE